MNKRLEYVYTGIYILNFAIILFFSLVIFQTTLLICEDDQARDFLELAKYLPHIPWQVPLYCVSCFLLIGVSNRVKKYFGIQAPGLVFSFYVIDLMLFIFITYNLNFSYKGLFLLLGAGAFLFIHTIVLKFSAIALSLMSFIFFDYDILTVRINMVSLQDYINYFDPQVQLSLYSVKSTLDSLNLILIVLFFYFLIQSKIQENKEFIRVNDELSHKVQELEVVQAKLEDTAKMKERNRLAHEIHDILGHSLTSISTGLEACIEVSRTEAPRLYDRLAKIKHVTDKGLTDIRRSVRELKNDAIEKSSLLGALQDLISDVNSMGRTHVSFSLAGEPVTLDDDEEQTVYRLVQESLTNSLKHGKATEIVIELTFLQHRLDIQIQDNGNGSEAVHKHFGLEHIDERIALLGGTVTFLTSEGSGFTTNASIPLRKEILHD